MGARVAMGGTFDVFHKGHRVLLETAFADAEIVHVGITTDDLANGARDRKVRPHPWRVQDVARFLATRGWLGGKGHVRAIDHPFGFALEPQWNAICVTPETIGNAERINAERAKLGLPALAVRVAPMVLADDGRPVRATRIVAGEIDEEGRLKRPAVVAVGTENPAKLAGVKVAFTARWPTAEFHSVPVASGVAAQPREAETSKGAENRARAALAAVPGADFGVGVEAGVFDRGVHLLDVQVACVVDAGGRVTWGEGPGFAHPKPIEDHVRKGATVGEALDALARRKDVGRDEGAVGWLSAGAVDRAAITEMAVAMALVPRARPDVYGIDRAP